MVVADKKSEAKTQECEGLNIIIANLQYENSVLKKWYEELEKQYKKNYQKFLKLEKVCKKLREKIKNYRLEPSEKIDFEHCKQALKKIEDIANYCTIKCIDCAGYDCRSCTELQANRILNIINGVKK